MLLKTSSSTKVYSSVNYDSLQTEHYCKLNALELWRDKYCDKTLGRALDPRANGT